jgi:hypothetical protein
MTADVVKGRKAIDETVDLVWATNEAFENPTIFATASRQSRTILCPVYVISPI